MNGADLLFRPGVVSFVFGPFHHARASLWRFVSGVGPDWKGRMLDVGCGGRPYRGSFPAELEQVGLDIDQDRTRARGAADVLYDGGTFPFDDASFDSVLCSQVLEHVFEPERFLDEIHRVLKPRGELLLTVPFLWPEHEMPWDAFRYTSVGLRSKLERKGFEILRQEKTLPGARTLLQLFQARLDQAVWSHCGTRASKLAARAALAGVHLPLNLLGVLLGLLPSLGTDLYLDNVVLARKAR